MLLWIFGGPLNDMFFLVMCRHTCPSCAVPSCNQTSSTCACNRGGTDENCGRHVLPTANYGNEGGSATSGFVDRPAPELVHPPAIVQQRSLSPPHRSPSSPHRSPPSRPLSSSHVMTSNVDPSPHDDHLRYLLDQRAARADLHTRFPSQSDFSDSPSLYSHGPFSPQQPHDTHNTPSTSFQYTLSVHNPYHDEPRSPVSDRERLNYPDASTLDLDDDPRSSYDGQSVRSSLRDLPDSGSEDDLDDDTVELEEVDNTVSTFGPKMTVHSRAPWEMDEEEDLPRNRKKKGVDKNLKPESIKRPWGLGTRPSMESRPSSDSGRSLSRSKQSFDTMSMTSNGNGGGSGGAILYEFASCFMNYTWLNNLFPQCIGASIFFFDLCRYYTVTTAYSTGQVVDSSSPFQDNIQCQSGQLGPH